MRGDGQTDKHPDKFKVRKGRASQVESPQCRKTGKGKKEKVDGQAQAGVGVPGGETDRQTGHPGHRQELPRPSGEIEMQRVGPRHRRRERQMAASSGKTRFQSRPLKWMLAS